MNVLIRKSIRVIFYEKIFFLEKQKNKPVHSYERRNKIIRIMTNK